MNTNLLRKGGRNFNCVMFVNRAYLECEPVGLLFHYCLFMSIRGSV